MQRIVQLWKAGMRGKLLIGCGGILALLFICAIFSTLFGRGAPPATKTPTPAPTIAKTEVAATPQPTAAPAVTSTLKPTSTPLPPTATPAPKPTNTPPPPTATPKPLPKVGETVAAGNWEYTVTSVEKAKTLTWSDFGNTSDAKGIWLIVYLTLKNVGKENFSINNWDFELNDSTGVKYNVSTDGGAFMFIGYKKLSNLGEQFPPGVAVKTALIYDIAPDAKGLRLQLKQAKTSIDLGQ